MLKLLDVEQVRFATMQSILALALKRDVMKFILEEIKQLNTPIENPNNIILAVEEKFPDLTVACYGKFIISICGKCIDVDNRLEVEVHNNATYESVVFNAELFGIMPAQLDQQIEKAKHALKRVVPLVARYNNSVKSFNRVESELDGLTLV